MMGATMKIGDKLKQLRICLNLTQEELAERCELSKGFISQIERDLTSPSIATLEDILECLGTNPAAFFQQTDAADRLCFKQEDACTSEDDSLGLRHHLDYPQRAKKRHGAYLVEAEKQGAHRRLWPASGRGIWVCAERCGGAVRGREKMERKEKRVLLFCRQPPLFRTKPRRQAGDFYMGKLAAQFLAY
jgi:transcriptional regulator with XRE-family HTH domain